MGVLSELLVWVRSLFGSGDDSDGSAQSAGERPEASPTSDGPAGDAASADATTRVAEFVCEICGTGVEPPANTCPLCGSTAVRPAGECDRPGDPDSGSDDGVVDTAVGTTETRLPSDEAVVDEPQRGDGMNDGTGTEPTTIAADDEAAVDRLRDLQGSNEAVLETHAEHWESSGGVYRVRLPDGETVTVDSKDAVCALLLRHY